MTERNFLDADKVRGTAKTVLANLQWKIIGSIEKSGTVLIRDSRNILASVLNEVSIKRAIDESLDEEKMRLAEYTPFDDNEARRHEAVFSAYASNANFATITIRKVRSARTGCCGWKIESADLKRAFSKYTNGGV